MKWILVFGFSIALYSVSAQNNNLFNAGLCHTNAPPTINPGAKGCRLALDTTTQIFYVWKIGTTWVALGSKIDQIIGCSAPLYTPNKWQSDIVINGCGSPDYPKLYQHVGAGVWLCLNCSGGGGAVSTDATLSGDGSGGSPLKIAQQSAEVSQSLSWTGTTWIPSWGSPYVYVTATSGISADVNTVLVGTISGNITLGLPTCNALNDSHTFEFKKNGADAFGLIIDPAGSQTFFDGATTKTIYSPLNLNCVCRFSAGTGTWFFTY